MPSSSAAGATGDIQVVARCAQLLRLFSTSQRSIRISDAAAELRLQRSTVHRYLSSLTNAGFLERDPDGGYCLGPLQVQLGTIALRGLRVLDLAEPYLQELANDSDQTAVIAVWGGMGPVVAGVHEPRDRLVNLTVRIGSPLPIDAAQSQAFLAFLADRSIEERLLMQLPDMRRREIAGRLGDIRRDGYAVSAGVVQGVRAVAVPVFEGSGRICATIAVVGTLSSLSEPPASGLLQALAGTAERLSRELGFAAELPFESILQSIRTAS
jgi:DNA-binding IclR family transcriptional regulator